MLAMSDTPIATYLPYFAKTGVNVAFLVPTPTGFEKSIMDATSPLRNLLKESGFHDYEKQSQGPENKVVARAFFVTASELKETSVSLYRPVTKNGDPRIWFHNLRSYCRPCNLLAIFVMANALYVINLSEKSIADSLVKEGFVYSLLLETESNSIQIVTELLTKLKHIHQEGFLPSITEGDPGVGDTLENALGISRNNRQIPDYKGIELKASRLTRGGERRGKTRSTLFAKVPDLGMTYAEIIRTYGRLQIPRNQTVERFQLECTLQASKANTYGLQLSVDPDEKNLSILFSNTDKNKLVSAWIMEQLKQTLKTKHHETFWVEAVSEYQDNKEFFRYDKVKHTKNPNTSLLAPLLETDVITVDLLGYIRQNGTVRDHGVLFKMFPKDLPLLFGEPQIYIL